MCAPARGFNELENLVKDEEKIKMTNKNKIKGYKFEAWLKKDLESENISVIRAGQANQPDLIVDGWGTIEAKCKKSLKGIYDMLGDNQTLVVKWQSPKVVRKPPIAILPYELFKELLKSYLK